jgi:hypothetical protein
MQQLHIRITLLAKGKNIHSRISREILDKIWTKFYQFDLYAGRLTRVYTVIEIVKSLEIIFIL